MIAVTEQKSNNFSLRLDGWNMQNMQFDPDKFGRLHNDFGPITLDAYATESNHICQKFCFVSMSFLGHPVTRETVFMCPSYSKQVLQMLQHFENARVKSSLDRRGIIVLTYLKL